jgi:hypothetical protein
MQDCHQITPAQLRDQYQLVAVCGDGSIRFSDIIVDIPFASLSSVTLKDSEFVIVAEAHRIPGGSQQRRNVLERECALHCCGDLCRSCFHFACLDAGPSIVSPLNLTVSSSPSSGLNAARSPASLDFPFIPDKQFMFDVICEWQERMHPDSQGCRACAVCAQ